MHFFGTDAEIQGLHLENNVNVNGRNRLGTQKSATQEIHNTLLENWTQGTWATQSAVSLVDYRNNYSAACAVTGFQVNQAWEEDTGTGNPSQPAEQVVTGNTFACDGALKAFQWEAACHNDGTEAVGRPNSCALDTGTSWDSQTYLTSESTVSVEYSFSGQNTGFLGNITQWKTDTSRDASSTITTSMTPPDFIAVDSNDYEEHDRCHVFVANWSLSANQSVDLSECLAVGRDYLVQHVNKTGDRGIFGPPEARIDDYDGGSVSLPTNSQQVAAYLIIREYRIHKPGKLQARLGRRGR